MTTSSEKLVQKIYSWQTSLVETLYVKLSVNYLLDGHVHVQVKGFKTAVDLTYFWPWLELLHQVARIIG